MPAKATTARRPRSGSEDVKPLVQTLIRRLVARACPHPSEPTLQTDLPTGANEVLFEHEVDGVRCVLVRRAKRQAPKVSLSPREREIARMVAKGYPNKAIAAVLEISAWTVGTHLRRIFAKLGVTSRAAMVAHWLELYSHDDSPMKT